MKQQTLGGSSIEDAQEDSLNENKGASLELVPFHICNCGKSLIKASEYIFIGMQETGKLFNHVPLSLYNCIYCKTTFAKRGKNETSIFIIHGVDDDANTKG